MDTKVQIASVAQSKKSALMREREGQIAAIVSIITSKEKTRDSKRQLLTHVDDKSQLFWGIDSLNVVIDFLTDELKELSKQ